MSEKQRFMDPVRFQPASVVIIDLVKHSTRDKASVYAIQAAMQEAFAHAKSELGISEISFTYTGDGYVCTLVGNAAARIMDFINSAIPRLQGILQGYQQDYRIGMDFGFIRLARDTLTGNMEHFDLPGINAARLESVAEPGKILCTGTFHDLFAPHYSGMFSETPSTFHAKDREITAYEVIPVDTHEIQDFFRRYLYGAMPKDKKPIGRRNEILIVDDETNMVEILKILLEKNLPEYNVACASSGEEALSVFKKGKYAVVITDIRMPGIDGIEVARRMLSIDPDQVIMTVSAYATRESAISAFAAGVLYYFSKPFGTDKFLETVVMAISCGSPCAFHARARTLCDDPGEFLYMLQETSKRLSDVLDDVGISNDAAHSLLRHKAKNIAREIVYALRPGNKILDHLSLANSQLHCVGRLSRIVARAGVGAFEKALEQLCKDITALHPKIRVNWSCTIPVDIGGQMKFGTTLVLVISELVDNAVTAMDRNGEVQIGVTYLASSGMICITVTDTGPGVPKEVGGSLFNEGVSSNGAGRGLGLALVRVAVEAMRGEISLAGTKPTTFQAIIPLP